MGPSKTKLVVDIKLLCFYSHLIPQIETILRYPLYTINYQFYLPPVHQISNIIFHNMETEDINIHKGSDIFTIQFLSKYPIALTQTTKQSLTSLYKNSVDISAQSTKMMLSLVTS